MKYITLAALAAMVAFTACNNNSSNTEESAATETQQPVEAAPVEAAATPKGPIDPVCEMEKEDTWTEYTVNGTDTVWFCSETCKTAYTGNPQKYQNKVKG